MLDKYIEFCDEEINGVDEVIEGKKNGLYTWCEPKEVVDNAITRCLGVAFFLQKLDINYDKIDEIYVNTKAQLMERLGK